MVSTAGQAPPPRIEDTLSAPGGAGYLPCVCLPRSVMACIHAAALTSLANKTYENDISLFFGRAATIVFNDVVWGYSPSNAAGGVHHAATP